METRSIKQQHYNNRQNDLKQLQRLEKVAWIVFIVLGIGYIAASIITCAI